MIEFREKVIAEIKSIFPNAKVDCPLVDWDSVQPMGFGMAEAKSEGDTYFHEYITADADSLEGAEGDLIFKLDYFRFRKDPDYVFIRLIDSGQDRSGIAGATEITYSALIRFSLGYKA